MGSHIEKIRAAVIDGKHTEIESLVKAALDGGVNLNGVIDEALIPAMDVVGQYFAEGRIYIPEMLVSSMTMKKGLEIIKPLLKVGEIASKGMILMGTVEGDLHDIGKNLVIMMLEGAGFQVIDLGIDSSVEKFVQQVQGTRPKILGLSALLTTTMPEMRKVIEALEERRLRDNMKVLVGGAPVTEAFAEKIGADGYGKDAPEAVQQARILVAGH